MTTAETTRSGVSSSDASGSLNKEELKADADRLKDTAQGRVSDEAKKRKSQATQTARSASDALEKAAGELESDENAPGWLSSAFRETAKSVERFAGSVDDRSPEQIGREASRFARQHPGSFLAASAAAGFAAARFLRAGADYREHHPQGGSSSSSSESITAGSRSGEMAEGRFASEAYATQRGFGKTQGGMVR